MPNWCENQLTVTGPKPELDLFQATCINADQELDFATILPPPVDLTYDFRYSDEVMLAFVVYLLKPVPWTP